MLHSFGRREMKKKENKNEGKEDKIRNNKKSTRDES